MHEVLDLSLPKRGVDLNLYFNSFFYNKVLILNILINVVVVDTLASNKF
jgi:hypothetical protein